MASGWYLVRYEKSATVPSWAGDVSVASNLSRGEAGAAHACLAEFSSIPLDFRVGASIKGMVFLTVPFPSSTGTGLRAPLSLLHRLALILHKLADAARSPCRFFDGERGGRSDAYADGAGVSRRTSRAGLSSRNPTKTVCRNRPSSPHVR
jgi:hypothetical protein